MSPSCYDFYHMYLGFYFFFLDYVSYRFICFAGGFPRTKFLFVMLSFFWFFKLLISDFTFLMAFILLSCSYFKFLS